jgi:hypothetical protein
MDGMSNKTRSMLIRLIVILVVGAVFLAGASFYKAFQKATLEHELLDEMCGLVHGDNELNRSYNAVLDMMFEVHPEAFKGSFEPSGWMKMGGTANVNRYQSLMVGMMIERSRSDGRDDLADALASFRDREQITPID